MNLSIQSILPGSQSSIESHIRTIPDFPRPGIMFKDLMPLLAHPAEFNQLIVEMAHQVRQSGATRVLGLEARGFLLGIPIAQELGLPFVPARKAGKLPGEVKAISYELEYGKATIEIQSDAIVGGDRIAVVDDLLATGGTANAAAHLVRELGGTVCGFFFAIELAELSGRQKLGSIPTNSYFTY